MSPTQLSASIAEGEGLEDQYGAIGIYGGGGHSNQERCAAGSAACAAPADDDPRPPRLPGAKEQIAIGRRPGRCGGATAFSQIRLNAWNQPFYDALQRKDIGAFLDQLIVVGVIANILLCLNVAQGRLNQMIEPKLRECPR